MRLPNDTSIGLASRFRLTVDVPPHDLGTWSKVSGLSDSRLAANRRRAGPGKVTLERPADTKTTAAVKVWLASMAVHPGQQTATIGLLDTAGHAITTWTFTDVMVMHWSIAPTASAKLAIETLELAPGG